MGKKRFEARGFAKGWKERREKKLLKEERANSKLHIIFAPIANAICLEPIASSVHIVNKE